MRWKGALCSVVSCGILLCAAPVACVYAQGVSPETVAGEKKIAGKGRSGSKRIFSAEPSVEPQTTKAIELSQALGRSLGKGVTEQSLAKHKVSVKKASTKGFATAASAFSISRPKADGRAPVRGKVRVSGGELFVAFIPTDQGGVVGVIEAWKRPVGKQRADIEREIQMNALGFKVRALVDSYQLVLWDKLSPNGLDATVASKPDLVTAPLRPALTASLLSRRDVRASSKVTKSMAPPPAILLAAISIVVGDRPKGPIGETQSDLPTSENPKNKPPGGGVIAPDPPHGHPREEKEPEPPSNNDGGACLPGKCGGGSGDKGDRTDPSGPPGGGGGSDPDRTDPSGPFDEPEDDDRIDPSGPSSQTPDVTTPTPDPQPSAGSSR